MEKVFGQTYTPSKYENFWATLRRKERMQLKKLVENADGIVALQNMLEHLRHKKIREVALRIRNKEILANVLSRVPLKRRNDLAEALQRDPFETIKRINDAIAMVEEDMESTAKYVAQRAAAEEKLDEILRAIRT